MFQKVVIQEEHRKTRGGREKYGDWLRIARKEDSYMLGEGGRPREDDSKWGGGSILHGEPQSHRVRVFAEMLRKTAATRRGSRDRMSSCGGCQRQMGGTKTSSESQGTLTNGMTGPKRGKGMKLPDRAFASYSQAQRRVGGQKPDIAGNIKGSGVPGTSPGVPKTSGSGA